MLNSQRLIIRLSLENGPCRHAILGAMTTTAAKFTDPWDAIHDQLEAVRKPIYDEIARYPMPITGCDAQYNYLLEKRDAILREIGRLEAASRAAGDEPDAAAAFIRDSPYCQDIG